eukprot:CAMPEP_0181299814 /NCGR_PEP_ID=MMETSP1101-20121128/6553_1 /TAXON_ID=46948 /ORGANISM="Rhodomonas abbreviata, Strain Caron Lab Isolate" /LENGTH=154 /DNA_ID=CAMNT_0023405001 /DNA_START=223 /DNA_END=684 /DNA_ORIENTATION=+
MQPAASSPEHAIPQEYACPITQSVMLDPVLASDGHTYERTAIEAWLATCKSQRQPPRSPLTGTLLSSQLELFPNHSLRKIISEFLDAHPAIRAAAEAEAAEGAPKLSAELAARCMVGPGDAPSPPQIQDTTLRAGAESGATGSGGTCRGGAARE